MPTQSGLHRTGADRGLESQVQPKDNIRMVIPGRVQNGVVVPQGASMLPEGADVTIMYPATTMDRVAQPRQRVQVPLVRTGQPASVRLTGEAIAEILDNEELPFGR